MANSSIALKVAVLLSAFLLSLLIIVCSNVPNIWYLDEYCKEKILKSMPYSTVENINNTIYTDKNHSFNIETKLPDTIKSYTDGLFSENYNLKGGGWGF